MDVLRDIRANYPDESFISQFLSPALIRRFRLFALHYGASQPDLRVNAIHNEQGYKGTRQALAQQYNISRLSPDIQVVDNDLAGNRWMILHRHALNGILLEEKDASHVLQYRTHLWIYDVPLGEIDPAADTVLREFTGTARPKQQLSPD